MRFEQTRALDAIERRLSNDPLRTGGVVDVAEVIRLVDLDNGKPVTLLRLGMLVDALARLLGDGGVALYPVAERGLLSDTELTSNERMVLRRWSDDGLLEILPAGTPVAARAVEISALTGQPVLTRAEVGGYTLSPVADGGTPALVPAGAAPTAEPAPHPVLARMWLCPTADCPSFGRPSISQPPPRLGPNGAALCPRHGEPLSDAGARPPVAVLVARVDGLVRHRFAVAAGSTVLVGRAPGEHTGVTLGPYLDERATAWISRRHVAVELRADGLYATDLSTNGTLTVGPAGRTKLAPGEPRRLAELETLELVEGVEVARAGGVAPTADAPASVMAEAPTIAIRLPRDR